MRIRIVGGKVLACLVLTGVLGLALPGSSMAQPKVRVAIGVEGTVNDTGWYESGYRAALRLKEDPGVDEVTYQERVRVPDLERTLRRWAVDGYTLILGHGYEWGEPAKKVARDFPNTIFAVAGFFDTGPSPNVINYLIQTHQTAYLAGMAAALTSKSKRIGIIGGFPIPQQVADHNGYILGARAADPAVKVSSVFINDWFDAAKAKEAALALIEQKADVLSTTAQPMGFGAYKAAEEKKISAIGIYVDMSKLAPETFITSVVFNWHPALKMIVEDVKRGQVKKSYLIDAPRGGSSLAPFSSKVPPSAVEKVRAAEKDIQSGKLTVPYQADKIIP